ncbi:MAG: class I SAM-dependent methyltransferase [Planctomycetota bacterium]|jgi:hypothetical protein
MTKKLHRKISSQWKGRDYQNWGCIKDRIKHLRKYLKYFKDKDVLDIGANAGMFGYDIAGVAKSYIGVEKNAPQFKQSQITKRYIKNKNARFHNLALGDFIKQKENGFNALFASYVLYHIYDEEVDLLKERVLPKCDTVIVYTRNMKRKSIKNKHKLEKKENVLGLLKKAGFKCKLQWSKTRLFHFILARRKDAENNNVEGAVKENCPGAAHGPE